MWNDNKDGVGQPKIIIPLSNAIWPSSVCTLPQYNRGKLFTITRIIQSLKDKSLAICHFWRIKISTKIVNEYRNNGVS